MLVRERRSIDRLDQIKIADEIQKNLRPSQFEYIDLDTANVLYAFPLGCDGWCAIIGHPEYASYEWVGRDPGDFDGQKPPRYRHSNSGYGCSGAAFRDGLVAMVD